MVHNTPLLSTAYLPSVQYMACLAKYTTVYIEQHETFPKQTFRNRTLIATGNGPLMLNVPVSRPQGNHTQTGNITVSYHEPWNIRHWRAIVSAYNAAPYFLYYRDGFEEILSQHFSLLSELNDALLRYILCKLKIKCKVIYTTDYQSPDNIQLDYRNSMTSKKKPFDFKMPPYSQVFDTRHGFIPNLSVIDLLFNLGPESKNYLQAL